MTPRRGLALSLLAALGIHAVILLVPRLPPARLTILPAVQIELAEVPAVMTGPVPTGAAPVRSRHTLVPQSVPARRTAPAQRTEPQPSPERAVPLPIPADVPEPPNLAEPVVTAEMIPPRPPPQAEIKPPAIREEAAPPLQSGVGRGTEAATAPGPGAGGEVSATSASPLIPPHPRVAIRPIYPRSARISGTEGLVKVEVTVEADGNVSRVEVFSSSGSKALDTAALEAVRRAAFSPATRDGKPEACRVVFPIRFRLSGSTQ